MRGDRNLLVFAVLRENGQEISRNLAGFAKPKYWKLQPPDITATWAYDGEHPTVELATDVCAPWTWIALKDSDARFSDNVFHLVPGHPLRVTVKSPPFTETDALPKDLIITPLRALFRNPAD